MRFIVKKNKFFKKKLMHDFFLEINKKNAIFRSKWKKMPLFELFILFNPVDDIFGQLLKVFKQFFC